MKWKPPSLLNKTAGPLEDQVRSEALKDVLSVGGIAAAGGIGLRGLLGLKYMFGRSKPNLTRSMGPTVISIPTPVYTTRKDEQQAMKMATDKQALTRSAIPWYLPGITMAGVGGLAGGYKLMDLLMDRKRKLDLQDEMTAAKGDYQQALLDQYNPSAIPAAGSIPEEPLPTKTVNPLPGQVKLPLKMAAHNPSLDTLADAYVKQAMPDWMGKMLGVYGAGASLLALGSGVATYRMMKDRSTNKLLEDAIKQRERDRWARRPPEVYAIPTPVRLSRGGDLSVKGTPPSLPGAPPMASTNERFLDL
jgi:hypothetical protein